MTRREPAPEDRPRPLVWADAAKGVCIVLVVLHHLVSKHYVHVLPGTADGLGATWVTVTYELKPVRLPLFFLISGFFAAGALRRPWAAVWRTRLANLYVLYAVWLCIHAVLFVRLRELPMNRTRSGPELALDLLLASTGLWYLYALVVYFAAARLLLPLGPRSVVLLAAAVALVTPWLGIAAANRAAVLQHFVYFVVGALFPTIVARMTLLRTGPVLGLTAAAVLGSAAASALDVRQGTTTVLVSLAGLPLAVRGAVALTRWPRVSTPLASLGRRTLPIYVLHVPVLAVAHLVLAPRLQGVDLGAHRVTLAVYPLLGTAAVVAGCLLLHRGLQHTRVGWLFRGPFRGSPSLRAAPVLAPLAPAPVPAPAATPGPGPLGA